MTKKRRRKLKEKKPTFQIYDGDTTAPDTPPELRSPSAVQATVHTADPVAHSSEYDTASAHLNSREVTPDTGCTAAMKPLNAQVAGQADVGQNVVIDFAGPRNPPKEEDDLTPVHLPSTSQSTPSTPTLTDDQHIIVMEKTVDNKRKDKSAIDTQMESTV